ncbi:MAG: hypothetical protein ACYDAO_06395 [Thermoplasmataceae archaeon]
MVADKLGDNKKENLMEKLPVSEVKLISPEVAGILVHNASKSTNPVEYEFNNKKYSSSFGYYEKKIKSEEGVYDTVPAESELKDLISVVFIVKGFHKGITEEKETEIQITEGRMISTPRREEEHLIEFQNAVLKKGRLN